MFSGQGPTDQTQSLNDRDLCLDLNSSQAGLSPSERVQQFADFAPIIPAIDATISRELQVGLTSLITESRVWWRGIGPEGKLEIETDSKVSDTNTVSTHLRPENITHNTMNSVDVLHLVTRLGREHVDELRDIGKKLLKEGVTSRDPVKHDVLAGVETAAGNTVYASPKIIEFLSNEIKAVMERNQRLSWLLPDIRFHFRPPGLRQIVQDFPEQASFLLELTDARKETDPDKRFKKVRNTLHKKGESGELIQAQSEAIRTLALHEDYGRDEMAGPKHRSHVIGLAVALGRLSNEQYEELLYAVPENGELRAGIASVLSPAEHYKLCQWQFASCWGFRKWLEQGGTSHPEIKSGVKRFEQLQTSNMHFAMRMTNSIFENFRFLPETVKEHLFQVGNLVAQSGYALDQGEFVSPIDGIPLLIGNEASRQARIYPAVADVLAYHHHASWLANRALSHQLPNELQQDSDEERNRRDGAAIEWDLSERNRKWNPDIVNAYCLTIGLSGLVQSNPELVKRWLTHSIS